MYLPKQHWLLILVLVVLLEQPLERTRKIRQSSMLQILLLVSYECPTWIWKVDLCVTPSKPKVELVASSFQDSKDITGETTSQRILFANNVDVLSLDMSTIPVILPLRVIKSTQMASAPGIPWHHSSTTSSTPDLEEDYWDTNLKRMRWTSYWMDYGLQINGMRLLSSSPNQTCCKI